MPDTMKVKFYAIAAFILCSDMAAPAQQSFLDGEAVFKNDEVVFHQIDEHTWVGTGNLVYNESLYLVEGTEKAVLIDAGTRIKDLDKIVATITKKPIMLVATHVHNDHTGSAVDRFPEIYINPGDKDYIPQVMPRYKGNIKFLTDGEEIDLGGRKLEVVFTPGHTPGSTTFIDKNAAYGFSGDSFGSGNLLLSMDFSTLIATCERMSTIMENYGIKFLFPGHYYGNNAETKQRVDDMITLSKDVISGKVKGEKKSNGMMGLNLVITDYGVNINYSEKSIK
jgi:glyoxylase-like metal-dependent hydrolase (beta-lactamase superfamily II)